MRHKIILDTDIGDDIDDALALGLICSRPEIALLGVTTVFGNVAARSRQAQTVLSAAGDPFRSVPVASGCGAAIASRPVLTPRDPAFSAPPNQDASALPADRLPPPDPRHGVDFLIETILAGDGDIVPVPIGAMTNLAVALVKEPRLVAKIPRIIAMAGEIELNRVEWNVRCDPEAASIVFSSGIPIDLITWKMGRSVQFTISDIERLAACDRPLARNLSHAIALWRGNDPNRMPALYDPLTIVALLEPDILSWRQGFVSVDLRGDRTYGMTTFRDDAAGPHRAAFGVDRARAIDFFFQNIVSV